MKITKDYIINTHYNGIHPTCACGCGTLLSFKPVKNGPWFSRYTKNHAPRKKHTNETKQKIKESCRKSSLEKYGVENPFQSTEVREKIRQTNLARYGVENYTQSLEWSTYAKTLRHTDDTKLKIKQTNQTRYSANSFTASDVGRRLRRRKTIERYYGSWEVYTKNLENSHIVCLTAENDFYSVDHLKFMCILCNTTWSEVGSVRPVCDCCQKKISQGGRSKLEATVFAWASTLDIPFVTNKIFTNVHNKKYSLDVYFTEHNIGIEINGLWWHSELHGQKNKSYHLDKLNFFRDKNIRVINIFEDEWNTRGHIIKSKLLHILHKSTAERIAARKCSIREITAKDCREFIELNHIQGFSPATTYLGAFHNERLVGCMTFSSVGRFTKKTTPTTYELVRFVTDTHTTSIGVGGKLLQHFIKKYRPTKIISYADRRFTVAGHNIYNTLGFTLVSTTPPNYFYVRGSKRYHRIKFQKHKLPKLLEQFDPTKTEWENMKMNKYDRIWDCGHLKYEMDLT
jgi:hypothetical protein